MQYSEQIDVQISSLLKRRGSVASEDLAGASAEQGASLLAEYAHRHSADAQLSFDGHRLRLQAPQPAPLAEKAASPVDQVLSAPPSRSMLEVERTGAAYPKWIWWMVMVLGLPGGIIGFFLVRRDNMQAARTMLVVGVLIQLTSWLMWSGFSPMLSKMAGR